MDVGALIAWIGSALGVVGSLAFAYREKARRAALEADRALEQERQESAVQTHLLARLGTMDTRIGQLEQQLESERSEARRVRWELEDKIRAQAIRIADQEELIQELGADKARLAQRVVELEREVALANEAGIAIRREFEESLKSGGPSHKSERPLPLVRRKKTEE